MFDKDKRYTIQEIAKTTGQLIPTLYKRRKNLFPKKELDLDGIMRFNNKEIGELLKFRKRGRGDQWVIS